MLSKTSTLKGRQKLCCKKFDTVKKFLVDVNNNHYFAIQWDEKLLKSGKAFNHEEHLAVLASATDGKLVKLLGTTDLDSGTALNQETAIRNMLERNIKERCVAMCFDTTASNTGKICLGHVFSRRLSLDTLCCGRHVVAIRSKSYWGMSCKQYLTP